MQLSIIIPIYNKEEGIRKLLYYLREIKAEKITSEIIIVDGGSTDQSVSLAEGLCHYFQNLRVIKSSKGRAKQMNTGAEKAKGKVLYFLHADTFPPRRFDEYIVKTISEKTQAGSFRMKFDKDALFFNFWSWFTRFKWNVASGGDQSLFITKNAFNQINGFNEDWIIMEDIEIISKIKAATNYVKLTEEVTTSARKYEKVGALKLQAIFSIMHIKKILGVSPIGLLAYYQKKVVSQ